MLSNGIIPDATNRQTCAGHRVSQPKREPLLLNPGAGEIAALATACCWTVSMMAFEAAGKRIGSLNVNLARVVLGALFLSGFCYLRRGLWLPSDASLHTWMWLSASGIAGLTLGDMCLLKAFVLVGSRISALIMAFVPMLSALISWLFLGELLSLRDQAGMLLTTTGIVMVVLRRPNGKARNSYPMQGLLLALGGAIGQSVGLVFSKFGMGTYDAFAANHIRLLAALAGFVVIFLFTGRWRGVPPAARHRSGMGFATLGSFFGPFVGVSLSLYAVQHTQVGVAATIIALVPVFIIPPAVLFKKEVVGLRDITGAFIAVAGSVLLFL
jgi:drug/metabolite transporter (DMT)-like permease